MHASHPFRLVRRALAVAVGLWLAAAARADEPTFSAGLSSEDRTASGLSHLTATQLAIMDGLVAQDVTAAHDGGVTAFSTGFSERHWAHERSASGLDQLTATERAVLDRLAARAIALGPPPQSLFQWQPPKKPAPVAAAPAPAPKPGPTDAAVSYLKQLEVHGDVSFTVGGASHGGSFYGTSDDVVITDPVHNFSLAFGVDDYHAKGPVGLYAAGYPYNPYGLYGPFSPVPNPAFWNW